MCLAAKAGTARTPNAGACLAVGDKVSRALRGLARAKKPKPLGLGLDRRRQRVAAKPP